jgi:predicted amidophosphoribosyltransferase
MHRSRIRSRGYNQSEILGRRLAKRLDTGFRDDVLNREQNSVPQSEQPTASARHNAIKGAFTVRAGSSKHIGGRRVLLVDDVFTTGSTVKAAAETLKAAGASWVGAAVLTVQPVGSLK